MDFNLEIGKIIDDGISLIPVPEDRNTRKPYVKWSGVKTKYDFLVLRDLLGKFGTTSVAIVLGVISEGTICIDVDTKHKDGFDAIIINDFKELYPDLWKKFRVEKTPSGGYHFLYKIEGLNDEKDFPRQGNLASRLPNESELLKRPDIKTYCFLEIKAQGSLTHCYPSKGYLRIKESEDEGRKGIGVLTWQEHCTVISQCRFYDEIIKEDKPIRLTQDITEYYEVGKSPYELFNSSMDGASVLEEFGWTFFKRSGKLDYYQKPGRSQTKSKDVDAFFNTEKRTYKIYTTTTEVLPKTYSPSNLLSFLKYGESIDAKKQLYAYLVAKGYGVIKRNIEKNIIKKKAKYGGELPANISEVAKEEYESEKLILNEKYPYGIFWKSLGGLDGGFKIIRERLYCVARELGFRNHKEKCCLIDGYKVKIVENRMFFDSMKNYIKEEDQETMDELLSAYEIFIQNSGKFTIDRLDTFDIELLLKSAKQISYKFYSNCYIKITKENREILDYEKDLTQLVWDTDIKQRPFEIISDFEESLYYKFLNNAIGFDDYLAKCIGFYTHDHRDEEGYLCITTEKGEGAGTGKNIFWSLLGLATTFKSTSGDMVNLNNNLLQSWDGQRIFCLSDLPKEFKIGFFKDIVTGNANVNKKYINEYEIKIEDMCKIGASSNFVPDDISDPGLKRRIRMIEFGDYYQQRGGVRKVHGKMFPKDWSSLDYLHFDNIIVYCIQTYLKADSIIDKENMSEGGWSKQFDQKYNHLHDFIKLGIENWKISGFVKKENFHLEYNQYCNENNIRKQYTIYTINKALVDFCKHNNIGYEYENVVYREPGTGVLFRGRKFFDFDISTSNKLDEEDVPF